MRARYWNEALEVFDAHPALGAGATGYADGAPALSHGSRSTFAHAHGFVVQTLADLGIVGLLLTLALLAAGWPRPGAPRTRSTDAGRRGARWLDLRSAAAPRPGWRAHREAVSPERIGLLSMLCIVVVFGVHSLIDWTWYVPGNACVALLCAGWLAGRGLAGASRGAAGRGSASPRTPGPARSLPVRRRLEPAHAPARSRPRRRSSRRCSPRGRSGSRSARRRRQQALVLLAAQPAAALASARTRGRPRPALGAGAVHARRVQRARPASARSRGRRCSRPCAIQPSNPQTWLTLGALRPARRPAGRRCASCRRRSTSIPSRSRPNCCDRSARTAKRSKSRTTTSKLCARSKRPLRSRHEARAHGASEQQRGARPAAPRPRAPRRCSKPKSPSRRCEHARACRSAGGRSAGRSAPSNARRESARRSRVRRPCAGVLSSSLPPERSTRRSSESHAAVSATCSIVSPAHTTSKLASASGHGPSLGDQPHVQARDALARARRSGSSATSTATTSRPRARARPRSGPRRSRRRARARRARHVRRAGSSAQLEVDRREPSGSASQMLRGSSLEGTAGKATRRRRAFRSQRAEKLSYLHRPPAKRLCSRACSWEERVKAGTLVRVAFDSRPAVEPARRRALLALPAGALRETAAPGDEIVETHRPSATARSHGADVFHSPWMEGAMLHSAVPDGRHAPRPRRRSSAAASTCAPGCACGCASSPCSARCA